MLNISFLIVPKLSQNDLDLDLTMRNIEFVQAIFIYYRVFKFHVPKSITFFIFSAKTHTHTKRSYKKIPQYETISVHGLVRIKNIIDEPRWYAKRTQNKSSFIRNGLKIVMIFYLEFYVLSHNVHTHTHTRTRTHTRARAHTHTHTHTNGDVSPLCGI